MMEILGMIQIMREKIMAHLVLSDRFEEAANKILENNLDKKKEAANYDLDVNSLRQKIDIKKRKKEFDEKKSKFEAAIKEVIEKRSTQSAAAFKYGIQQPILSRELKTLKAQGPEEYTYDRTISYMAHNKSKFTFLQEESLLNDLKKWKHETRADCICQLCALQGISILAVVLAKDKGIACPSYWIKHKWADIDWLIEFEMRHHDEIFSSFKPFKECKFKDTVLDC